MRWLLIALLLAGALLSSAGPAMADTHQWRTYANVRFAYQVCYPADLLKPQPEVPNGDGRRFTGANGAELAVYGSYQVDTSLSERMKMDEERIGEHGGAVTYRVSKPGWYVLSGRQGDAIIYMRTRLVDETSKAFEIRYPASDAARWTPVVEEVGRCFRSLEGRAG